MRRYRGNEKVQPGIYFNARQLVFKSMGEEGHLPGTEQDQYRRVPTLVLLAAGPVLGGLYVIFLPLLGFAMLGWFAGRKVLDLVGHAAEASVRALKPAWQPARAFLSRGKPAEAARERKDGWAEDVEKELEQDDEGVA